MPHLKEILEKERLRDTEERFVEIHLFREGTFYRAYEWSAWLCVRYFTEMKVTHRVLKGGEDVVFVGFPLTSLERYTPKGAEVRVDGDECVGIVLPREVFRDGVDAESLQEDFGNWKQSQPLTEASKKAVAAEKARTERGGAPEACGRDARRDGVPDRAALADGVHGVSGRGEEADSGDIVKSVRC